jgi:hypothetical protein
MQLALSTQADWQQGVLPPQMDITSSPGDVKLYRPSATFARASSAYLPDGSVVAAALARYWWGRWQNRLPNAGFTDGIWTEEWNAGWGTGTLVDAPSVSKKGIRITLTASTVGNAYGRVSPRSMDLVEGQTIVVSFLARANRNGVVPNYMYLMSNNTWSNSPLSNVGTGFGSTSLTTEWLPYWKSFVIPAGKSSNIYGLMLGLISTGTNVQAGDWAEFADIQIEEAVSKDSQGNYIPTSWRYGTKSGLIMEEGTNNLVQDPDFELGTNWNYAAGASRISGQAYHGNYCARLYSATPQNVRLSQSIALSPSLAVGERISVTVRYRFLSFTSAVYSPCTYVTAVDENNAVYDSLFSGSAYKTATAGWVTDTVSYTNSKTSPMKTITIYPAIANGFIGEVLIDFVQIERKALPTSTTIGVRQPETLTITPTGLNLTEGTIEMWFKPFTSFFQPINSWQRLIGHSTATNRNEIELMRASNTNKLAFAISNDAGSPMGTGWVNLTTSGTVVADVWHHVAVVWSLSQGYYAIFLNGIKSSMPLTATYVPSILGTWAIGYHPTVTDRTLNGMLSDIHGYTRALADAEIVAHANAVSPASATESTLVLMHMNNSLVSDYPSRATGECVFDLGTKQVDPVYIWDTITKPAGTDVTINRVRTGPSKGSWGEWGTLSRGGVTPWAPDRYLDVEFSLATTDPNQTPVLSQVDALTWDPIAAIVPNPIAVQGVLDTRQLELSGTIPGEIPVLGTLARD